MGGDASALAVSAVHEEVGFEIRSAEDIDLSTSLVRILYVGHSVAVGARVGIPLVEYESGSEQDESLLGGAEVSLALARWDRVGLLSRATADFGSAAMELPQGTSDLAWFQADALLGVSYLPNPQSAYALSPAAGFGCRLIDGFQDFDRGSTEEFDASLPYVFLGANWNQSFGTASRWSADAMLLVGDIHGFQVCISLFF